MTESERAKSLRRRYGNRMAEAPRRRGPEAAREEARAGREAADSRKT